MNNANAIHNRFMRLALYVHKRQHGATVVVRRKVQVQADPETGETQWQISQWKVPRVVVLPAKNQREVRQNAGAMTANRAIVQGSSLDTGGRRFIFDRRDLPPDLVLQKDDWIVFNRRHYDIESITDYEYDTAWLVIGKELKGRIEVCDMRTIRISASDQLALEDNVVTNP
jgi:hypothetical protein